jgi:lycopene beta-cyclase
VVHDDSISTITCSDGTCLSARVVVDASGHSRSLVKYDKPFDPGYQVAYGVLAEVSEDLTNCWGATGMNRLYGVYQNGF